MLQRKTLASKSEVTEAMKYERPRDRDLGKVRVFAAPFPSRITVRGLPLLVTIRSK